MINPYKNILVGLDNSEESHLAFSKAVEIAKSEGSKLILVHIIDTRLFTYAVGDRETLIRNAEEFAEELLSTYEKEAKEAGIREVIKEIDHGSPKVKIPRNIARKYEIDLIVCGATGYNAIERVLIGSVSENIFRHAKCDVLVVRK